MDIMFVNKIPFVITYGCGVRFGTIENIKNRRVPTVAAALDTVIRLYHRRGLIVGTVNVHGEFKPLQEEIPSVNFNLCTNDEHVPEIEQYIRTAKDRMRSGYNSLPFEWVPRMMVIRLVANSVFWLNAFPHPDSMSDSLLPRFLITGQRIDYKKHVRLEFGAYVQTDEEHANGMEARTVGAICLEFGAYVQTHEEHTNGMESRTVSAICLGPTGNEQGGHYFMSLGTGRRLTQNRWTELPMLNDAIAHVNELGR
jgi:hypothetical protein